LEKDNKHLHSKVSTIETSVGAIGARIDMLHAKLDRCIDKQGTGLGDRITNLGAKLDHLLMIGSPRKWL
jgi:hypothetical protein